MRTIVFVLRGCSAGWLGAYGNEWVATPNLDRAAAESVVFDHHLSDCPDPEAARRAWVSGRHQIPATDGVPSLDHQDAAPRLPGVLRAAGVRTVLVRANHPDTDLAPWYYAAWDEVFDARPEDADLSPLDALIRAFPSVLDRLGDVPRWLIVVETDRLVPPWDVRQDVFDAYLDVGDDEEADAPDEEEDEDDEGAEAEPEEPAAEPVTPWADPPTGPFDRADLAAWDYLHRSFAAVVTSLDAELGTLFDQLRARGLDQTAAWVVTSDYGHPLGEHGQVGPHRPWLHEEFVHLPLLLRLPAAAEGGRRVPAFTQPADLCPTLWELLGAALPAEPVHGHSLLPLATGMVLGVRPYACSGLVLGGKAGWAIRAPDWALQVPAPPQAAEAGREPQLYEKPDDRWEVNDLRARNIERADRLDAVLRKYAAAVQHPGPLVVPPLEES
jgi:arylsulfatase A-like enzyme